MSPWQTVVDQPDELGESPFWHPAERRLYWIDIHGRQLRRLDPRERRVESWPMPADPGCIAPAAGGGLVIALRDGVYRARQWHGALTLLLRLPYDQATTRFNDGKADPAGRFWAGTMYEPRDERKAGLYSIDLRSGGQPLVELKADNAVIANGLAWAPDGRTVYWADTTNHVVYAWDWDARSNALSRRRVFQQFPRKPDGWQPGAPGYRGRPDGATVDSEGNYWCAMFEGGRILKFAPSGAELADIAVPVRCPTMPCFGGDDLRTLFVTSARHGRAPEELREQPQAGCVIAMRVDVAGLPADFVRDQRP